MPPAPLDHPGYPKLPAFGRGAFWFSLLASWAFGGGLQVAEMVIPGLNLRGAAWVDWTFGAIWLPFLAGLLLAVYSVAKYPYLSLVEDHSARFIPTGSCVWRLMGGLLWLIATPMTLLLAGEVFAGQFDGGTLAVGIVVPVLWSVGWTLMFYRPERYPTVATLFLLTDPVGPFLILPYLPSVVIGSQRLKRAMELRAMELRAMELRAMELRAIESAPNPDDD